MSGYPYVFHSWGAEVFLYLSYSLLGMWGVTLLYALVATISVLFIGLSVRLFTNNSFAWLLLPLFSGYILAVSGLRTQLFTFTLLCLLIHVLLNKKHSPLTDHSQTLLDFVRKLLTLFVLFMIWVNLHGGFVVGLLVLGVFLLTDVIVSNHKLMSIGRAIIVMVTSLIATLINPYTYRSLEQAFAMGTNTSALQSNGDWLPIQASKIYQWQPDFVFVLAVSALLFILVLRQRDKYVKSFITATLFAGLLFISKRYMIALAITLLPLAITELYNSIKQNFSKLFDKGLIPFWVIFALIICSTVVTNIGNTINNNANILNFGSQAVLTRLPAGVFEYMQQNDVPDRMLNEYDWGGYLEWIFPQNKYFIDGRMDNFFTDGESFLVTFGTIIHTQGDWEKRFNSYNFNAVLLKPGREIVSILRDLPEWRVVYEDADAILILRDED